MADAHRKRPQPDDLQPSTSHANVTTLSHRSRVRPNQESEGKPFSPRRNPASVADDDDDDFTSSSGSDSSDADSDNDDEEDERAADDEHEQVESHDGLDHPLPHLPARQKPRIHHVERDADLLSRISAFLPKMRSANDELQREIDAGRAKDVRLDEVDDQDEGQYIEMNLGLGVLEEKRQGEKGSDHASNEDLASSAAPKSEVQADSNVLGTLMGQEDTSSKKPTIEEMRE
ncbi:hypothetical protein BDV59DRAFT_205851 [Aspergillus ambiguus]|uniref:NOPCHAP1/New4 family protein n=1 Tax=Aspergillus ambiguus TaxID=176160 RepID=UPI003CCE14F9